MGQPQLRSTKSMLEPISLAIISAVGTSKDGLLPASCMPKVFSEGCLRTSDHSSFDPFKKEFAKPTRQVANPRVSESNGRL